MIVCLLFLFSCQENEEPTIIEPTTIKENFDYNEIRSKIKNEVETKASIQNLISEHLSENLSKITFRNKTSVHIKKI